MPPICYNHKMSNACIFCNPENAAVNKIIIENDLAYSRWDNYPVSNGHAEVIPKRHVASYFELTNDELQTLFILAKQVKHKIDDEYNPDAYNIGVNDGLVAGQSIPHCHIHIIPRYSGDVQNPRGGVRNIIPGKGDY